MDDQRKTKGYMPPTTGPRPYTTLTPQPLLWFLKSNRQLFPLLTPRFGHLMCYSIDSTTSKEVAQTPSSFGPTTAAKDYKNLTYNLLLCSAAVALMKMVTWGVMRSFNP